MSGDSNAASTSGQSESFLTLAGLLNVLWRRRLLVLAVTGFGLLAGVVYGLVKAPLYLATAQVRPGITAYSVDGGPFREWRLKDVTRFFQRGFYEKRVAELIGWPEGQARPIIKAEFIARGASNIQGGNVITLQNLSESPVEAAAIINAAITSFMEYAESDSVGNALHLTRAGLAVRISEVRNCIATLEVEKSKMLTDVDRAKLDLTTIDAKQQRLELELRGISLANEYRQNRADRSDQEADTVLQELDEIRRALELLGSDSVAPPEGGAESWLVASLARRDAEAIGTIVQSQLQVRSRAFMDQANADSLRYEVAVAGLTVEDLLIRREIELQRERAGIELNIKTLELRLGRGIENRRQSLLNEIIGLQVQERALSPLERLGEVKVSHKPVRPRKMRAVAILTILGFIAALALAFVWEYFEDNRSTILARKPRRA